MLCKFDIYPVSWETKDCKTKSKSKPKIAFSGLNDNCIYVYHPFSIKESSSTYRHRHIGTKETRSRSS